MKTKSFKKLLEKRFTKEEIEQLEKEAEIEAARLFARQGKKKPNPSPQK